MYEFGSVAYNNKGAMLSAMINDYYGNYTTRELIYLLGDEWPTRFAEEEADALIQHWNLSAHMERAGYDRRDLVAALTAFWKDVALGIDPRLDY